MPTQDEIEARINRNAGMNMEKRIQLSRVFEELSDWTARCTKCGTILNGTLVQIRAHRCDAESQ